MHVFSLLHEDHENVALIFKKIDSMKSQETAQTHEQLFKELSTELELYAKVEEDMVYPVFRNMERPARSSNNRSANIRRSTGFFLN